MKNTSLKKWISLLTAMLLLAGLCPAAVAETAATPENPEKHVTDYAEKLYWISSILDAGEKALADGMDPKKVGEEMYALADANDMLPYFSYACENTAAVGTAGYEKLNAFLKEEKGIQASLEGSEYSDDRIRFDVYESYECSEAMKAILSEIGTEYCPKPYFWTESDFQKYYGTAFKNFKPARPREGYVCIVVQDDAQSAPETAWNEGTDNTFTNALNETISRLMWEVSSDAPVLTGNPQLASTFWVFDLKYPFYAWYGKREIRGFDCVVSLSVQDAATKKAVASLQQRNRLPNVIYSWHNGMAEADVPSLSEAGGYTSFTGKVRTALKKERSAAATNRKMTALNADSVLKGILINQTEKLNNNWQKAIYESGAEYVALGEGELTFYLRSYDPKLTEIGAYKDAADPKEWLRKALENAAAYDLAMKLDVENGLLTKKSLQTLKNTVNKAAAAAQKAWGGKDMTAALKEYFFPAPVTEKVTSAEQLMSPSASFGIWSENIRSAAGDAPEAALAALFYAQKNQTLNLKGGPHEVIMTCTGADPAGLMKESAREALDELAYVTAAERIAPEERETLLLRKLTEKAFKNKTKGNAKTNLTVDLDALAEGNLPEEYLEYLAQFAYDGRESSFLESAEKLPEMAAIKMTQSAKLSGGNSGTQVRIKIPADGEMTYVQVRNYGDESIQGSAFVLPGKMVTLRVPQGSSYLVYCSGPYWYGEQDLFCDLGSYHKSEELEIKSNKYYHTFTLETTEEGDVNIYGADPSDFQ